MERNIGGGGGALIIFGTDGDYISNLWDKTFMDLIFEFDNHGVLTRYYTFNFSSFDLFPNSKKACRRDCGKADSACIESWHEDRDIQVLPLCKKALLEQRAYLKQCDYDVAVPSYDSKNDSGQACNFNCYESEKACIDSINEGEDTSKGTLLCEKEKEMCFNRCDNEIGIKLYNPKPDDCDPGLESCN